MLNSEGCNNVCFFTGKRLKELNETYTILYYSTMPRAVETAQLVNQSLPDVPMKSCDLLREGAPIRPDPPSKHWRPEEHVSQKEIGAYSIMH